MYMCPECHVEEHKKKDAPKISQIRLTKPKQPQLLDSKESNCAIKDKVFNRPKARRKKKRRKYGYTAKERKFLSKFRAD